VVERALELCRYQILKAGVSAESDLRPDVPSVLGVSNQLEMAIINLVVNALHAMGRGGHLRIATRSVDGAAQISVEDDGCGIPAAIQPRVFQPFVTTRPEGQGTGLGLSTVQRIVERHGGRVRFTTEEGEGTTFTITLPGVPPAV